MKNKIYISLTLIICFSFIVFGNYKTNQISGIDNRKLLEFPKISPYKTFGDRFENYLKDRIAFREKSIGLYTKYTSLLFDRLEHSIYEEGKEGYFFFKVQREGFNADYIDIFISFLNKVENFLKVQREIPFIVWFNPSKISIYEKYLPEGYTLDRDKTEYFLKGIRDNNILLIDATEILKKESEKKFVFNKKHDAGHWNNYGAFIGFSEFLKGQKILGYDVELLKEEEFNITTKIERKLYISSLEINEEIPVFKRKEPNVELVNFEGTILNESYRTFEYFKNKEVNNGKRLLIFRGSYLNEKLDYVADRYSEVISIHSYHNIPNLLYSYNIFKPDIIAFELAEYVVSERYFPKDSMNKFLSKTMYNKILNYSNIEFKDEEIDYTILIDRSVTNFLLNTKIEFDYGYLIVDEEEFIIHENLISNDFSYMTSLKTESYNNYRDKKSKFKFVLVQHESETKVEFDLEL